MSNTKPKGLYCFHFDNDVFRVQQIRNRATGQSTA